MYLAVNMDLAKWQGEHIATIILIIAALIAFPVAARLAKKKKPRKLEDTLPPAWRDRFFR